MYVYVYITYAPLCGSARIMSRERRRKYDAPLLAIFGSQGAIIKLPIEKMSGKKSAIFSLSYDDENIIMSMPIMCICVHYQRSFERHQSASLPKLSGLF